VGDLVPEGELNGEIVSLDLATLGAVSADSPRGSGSVSPDLADFRVVLMSSMTPELQRRQTNAEKVWALFALHPGRWLHWSRFAAVGGACAWRTRIADARKIAEGKGGQIVWNNRASRSAYRYVPAASEPSPDRWPIPGSPSHDQGFHLTPPEV
jgi:hypothetical protein